MEARARAGIVGGALFALMLSACGAVGATPSASHSAAAHARPAAAVPSTMAPMVTALLPSPSATPVVTPTPPPPPPTSPPAPASFSFAIVPRFAGGAGGTVTATPMADRVHYHVVVTGLVPGSAHTVHDHVGSCGGANLSRHLSVLATGVANGAGSLTFDATVPAFEFGSGRIVIVYDSARPVLITGCAAL